MSQDEEKGVYHAQGGDPVDQEVVQEGIDALEERMLEQDKVETSPESRHQILGEIIEEVASASDAALEEVCQEHHEMARSKIDAHSHEFNIPSPEQGREEVFTGSYGVTRTPGYVYQGAGTKTKGGNGADATANVDAQSGTIEVTTGSPNTPFHDGGYARAWAVVAGYIRPNISNGYMHVSVSPSFDSNGTVYQVLGDGHGRTKIGLLVGKYDANTKNFEKWTIEQWDTIDNKGKDGSFSTESSGHNFSAWTPVDNSHFYVPGIAVKAYSSAGGASTFHYSAANADIGAKLPYIRLALY